MHMKRLALLLGLLLMAIPVSAQQVTKEITNLGGKARAYYLFVPDKLTKDRPAPLLLLLHGSGRNGFSLVDKWKDLAKKEGIILVGPDSIKIIIADSMAFSIRPNGAAASALGGSA